MSDDHPTAPIDPEERRREQKRAATRRWRERNKERIAAYNKRWNAANKRAWYADNEEYKARQRAHEQARKEADPEAFKAAQAARMRAWRRRNPELDKARRKAFCEAHPEWVKAKKRCYYRRHRARISDRQKCLKYGLTPDRLAEMRRACKGRCQVCKVPFSGLLDERECVDHCHRTGAVRGLLCGRCNLLAGLAGDDPKQLRAMARYLERSKATCKTTRAGD
jgi:hypothetical protein